jgi:hypothetical protein
VNAGTGRSERLALDTAYNNELTNLNNAEQSAVNKLREAINQSRAAQTQEELSIKGEVGAQLAESLYSEKIRAEQARQDIFNRQMSDWKWAQEYNANQSAQEKQFALQNKQLELSAQAAESESKLREMETYAKYIAPAYSADYQAEINKLRVSGDPDAEWKIGILNSYRDGKVAGNEEAAIKAKQQEIDNQLAWAQIYKSGSGSGGSSSFYTKDLETATENIQKGIASDMDYAIYNYYNKTNYSTANPAPWDPGANAEKKAQLLNDFDYGVKSITNYGTAGFSGGIPNAITNLIGDYWSKGLSKDEMNRILRANGINIDGLTGGMQ